MPEQKRDLRLKSKRCRSPTTIPFCHGLRNAVLTAGMEDKEEEIGNLKGHRRHSEGIHSGESVTVILEEGHPTLAGVGV